MANVWLPDKAKVAFQNLNSASDAVRIMGMRFDPNINFLYTNFIGDTVDATWAAAKTNGTSAAVSFTGGQMTLTTGTDNDGYAGQGYGAFWYGDYGYFMESSQSIDTITTLKYEVGVNDSTADAGAVNVKATPTATATDFCVVVFDTDDNTQMDIISQDTSSVSANAENIHTLVAGTDFTTIFRAQGDVVDVAIGSHASNATSAGTGDCQGGTAVTPWHFAQARAMSASRVATIDYLYAIGPRS